MSLTVTRPLIPAPSQIEEISEVALTINDGLRIRDIYDKIMADAFARTRSDLKQTLCCRNIEPITLGLGASGIFFTIIFVVLFLNFVDDFAIVLGVGLGTGLPLILLSFTTFICYNNIINCISSRFVRNRTENSLDDLVSLDLIPGIFYFLSQEEIALLNSQQFLTAVHERWRIIQNFLLEGKLTVSQAELVRKMQILEKMNAEQILNAFSNDSFIEEVKSSPMLFEAFHHFITENYHGSARITASLQLLEQSFNEPKLYVPAHEDDSSTEDGDDDNDPFLEPLAACSSQTEEIQSDHTVTLIFNQESCSEPLSETWLKSKCKYFTAFFREKKVILHIDETKENFTLLLRALQEGINFVTLERLDTLLMLASKYFADEVIFNCTLFTADHLEEIDMKMMSKQLYACLDWDQVSDLDLQKHKLQITHNFIQKLFRSKHPQPLLDKILLFSKCFNLKGTYDMIQSAILMRFNLDLSPTRKITIDDFAHYLLIVELLMDSFKEEYKQKIIKLLNIHLNQSICDFWSHAVRKKHLPLKIAIAKFCLSEEGRSSLAILQDYNLWLTTRELQQLVDA